MNKFELLNVAKPILFNTEMVRAILGGRKTVTRRVIKQNVDAILNSTYHQEHPEVPDEQLIEKLCLPKYNIGDILYVRETWGNYGCDNPECHACYYMYRADYPDNAKTYVWPEVDEFGEPIICDLPRWRPSIHMPKWAARIFLRITDVRVEKLQQITIDGISQEGINIVYPLKKLVDSEHLKAFVDLWDGTIKKELHSQYSWNANPWVWVYYFERISDTE